MKRALIVAATGGFLNGFLIPDMKLLQEMGYEVHCAANGNSVSTFVPEERFASIGVTFHQIDFSSTSPISKESLTAYKQYKELLNRYHFDFVHVHKAFTKLSPEFCGYKALCEGARRYDAVVTGSDQLWSPAGLPTNFYNLMFVPDEVRKISYRERCFQK